MLHKKHNALLLIGLLLATSSLTAQESWSDFLHRLAYIFIYSEQPQQPSRPQEPQNLKGYVYHVIDHLFIIQTLQGQDRSALIRFKQATSSKIIQSTHIKSVQSESDRTIVYNAIIDECVSFIQHESFTYARELSQSVSRAQTASHTIRDEALKIITESGTLQGGPLSGFVGKSLRVKVQQHLGIYEHSIEPEPKRYPSQECCICLEEFSPDRQRVFLEPCGHDMCKSCAEVNFFRQNNKTCPQCRTRVNRDKLRQEVFAPSAPPFMQ